MPPRGLVLSPLRPFVLIAGALAVACGGDKPPQQQQMPPPQVTVVTLKAESVTLTRELPGRTSALLMAEVRPQVNGIIKKRLFTEGSPVQSGQALYQLDDSVYRAEHQNAVAALAKAKANLEGARLAAKRAVELRQIDAVSEQEKESAVSAQAAAQADVAAAQAMVAREQVNLVYSRITSPITGRIGISAVTAGSLVTANQAEPLATVQQLDPIHVDVSQSSSEWLRLKREIASGKMEAGGNGTAVTVVLEDGSKYPYPGKLQFSDVTVDPATGSFTVRVLVPNPENTLRPGMYVTAVLEQGEASGAVLAPQQGVTRDPKGNATAMVVGADGKVELRQIQVSRTVGDRWLVDSGLAAGDRVIVEGLQKVQPGMPAVAVEQGSAPATPPAGPAGAPSR